MILGAPYTAGETDDIIVGSINYISYKKAVKLYNKGKLKQSQGNTTDSGM